MAITHQVVECADVKVTFTDLIPTTSTDQSDRRPVRIRIANSAI